VPIRRGEEHREGERQRQIEVAHARVDLLGGRRDRDAEASVIAEIHGALRDAQAELVRALDIALAPRTAEILDRGFGQQAQPRADERVRARDRGAGRVDLVDLPIPAGERQIEARLAEIAGLRQFALRILADGGHDLLEVDIEPLVEGALGRLAVERGQGQPHQQKHEGAQHRG
jgi:hypothetical protein